MGRNRKPKNKNLPIHLHANTKNGKTYYSYWFINPQTGDPKTRGLGTNKNIAIQMAIALNETFSKSQSQILRNKIKQIIGEVEQNHEGEKTILFKDFIKSEFIDWLQNRRNQKGKTLAEGTIKNYQYVINRLIPLWGDRKLSSIRWQEIDDYLQDSESNNTRIKTYNTIKQIFKYAKARRYIEDNPVNKIEKLPEDYVANNRYRSRISLEQYNAIFNASEKPYQLVLEMKLNALFRRHDLAWLRFDMVDDKDHLCVVLEKTTTPLRIPLALPMAHSNLGCKTLGDLIELCRDEYLCPYILHRKPKRRGKGKTKDHLFQWGEGELSNRFKEARDRSGIFKDIEDKKSLPSFHECLSLGEALRYKQGWTDKEIQALRGHSNVRTTKGYLDGQPDYTTFKIPNIK